MEVMTLHEWHDYDIEKVIMSNENVREIVLKETNEGALLINTNDAIALAKEFGLDVYPKDARL